MLVCVLIGLTMTLCMVATAAFTSVIECAAESKMLRLSADRAINQLHRSGTVSNVVKRSFGDAQLGSLIKAFYRITPLPD